MSTQSYAFNEAQMMASIEAYQAECRLARIAQREAERAVACGPPAVTIVDEVGPTPKSEMRILPHLKLIRTAVRVTAEHFGVDPREIHRLSNVRTAVFQRRIVFWLIRKYSDISLSAVSRFFRKHHTTVFYALSLYEQDMRDPAKSEAYSAVEAKFLEAVGRRSA